MLGRFRPRRVAHQADQKRCLRGGQVGRRLVEVHPGRRLDSGRRTPVERLVEVVLEDLLLGHGALELQRQHRLLHFAHQRALVLEVGQLHVLLGYRRATLQAAAALGVLVQAAGDTERVEALVLEELPVLRRHHRLFDHQRDVVVGQRKALGAREDLAGGIVGVALADRHRRIADQRGARQRVQRRFGQFQLVEQAPHAPSAQHDDDHSGVPESAATPEQAALGGGRFGHDRTILPRAQGRRGPTRHQCAIGHSETGPVTLPQTVADGVKPRGSRRQLSCGTRKVRSRWFHAQAVHTSMT